MSAKQKYTKLDLPFSIHGITDDVVQTNPASWNIYTPAADASVGDIIHGIEQANSLAVAPTDLISTQISTTTNLNDLAYFSGDTTTTLSEKGFDLELTKITDSYELVLDYSGSYMTKGIGVSPTEDIIIKFPLTTDTNQSVDIKIPLTGLKYERAGVYDDTWYFFHVFLVSTIINLFLSLVTSRVTNNSEQHLIETIVEGLHIPLISIQIISVWCLYYEIISLDAPKKVDHGMRVYPFVPLFIMGGLMFFTWALGMNNSTSIIGKRLDSYQ